MKIIKTLLVLLLLIITFGQFGYKLGFLFDFQRHPLGINRPLTSLDGSGDVFISNGMSAQFIIATLVLLLLIVLQWGKKALGKIMNDSFHRHIVILALIFLYSCIFKGYWYGNDDFWLIEGFYSLITFPLELFYVVLVEWLPRALCYTIVYCLYKLTVFQMQYMRYGEYQYES